jgi:hypothetical protein
VPWAGEEVRVPLSQLGEYFEGLEASVGVEFVQRRKKTGRQLTSDDQQNRRGPRCFLLYKEVLECARGKARPRKAKVAQEQSPTALVPAPSSKFAATPGVF